jgi:hypothetical protein
MKRALKHAALDPPDEGQDPLPFFSEPAATPVVEESAAQIQPALHTRPASFYDEDGRFVPRCGCGAYGSFGLGVSLRHGQEGTWWCGLLAR